MKEDPNNSEFLLEVLADELNEMQSKENDGRGITVIRSVITWLRAGKIFEAKLEASHDHDKIRNYPEIEKLLKEKLFGGQELWRWAPKKDRES